MFGIVFVSLLVLTALVGGIGLVMFLDVAFAGPACLVPVSRGTKSRRESGNFDGAGLALKVEQPVSRSLVALAARRTVPSACDAACHEREIHVTTPEALAIVQELQNRLSPHDVHAIRVKVEQNLTAGGTHHCPLLMSGGFCACEGARPLSCRTRCIVGADSDVEAKRLAETVGAGAIDVFRACLHASGLDDGQYELNHAISRALDAPDAAHRWAHGEHILETVTISRA